MRRRRSNLLRFASLAVLAWGSAWTTFALAGPVPVPVDGVTAARVPDGFRGPVHEGVDIFAARGTPVRAVRPGVVVRKETQTRGGRVLFVLATDGVLYFYAHLDRWADVEPGTFVASGTILGYVGDTGNAKGKTPHLHFEARVVATGLAPVDPKLLFAPTEPSRRVHAAWTEIGDPR